MSEYDLTTYNNGVRRARRAYAAKCPECEADVTVVKGGRLRRHDGGADVKCPGSGGLPR